VCNIFIYINSNNQKNKQLWLKKTIVNNYETSFVHSFYLLIERYVGLINTNKMFNL